MYWVSKWVDYSDKYGFGYALCDESIGVVFNDLTKLLLLSDGRYYSENSISINIRVLYKIIAYSLVKYKRH